MASIIVERYEDGAWAIRDFKELKVGDVFRAFADPTTQLVNKKGEDVFIAMSNVISPNDEDEIETLHDVYNTTEDKYAIMIKGYHIVYKDDNCDKPESTDNNPYMERYNKASEKFAELQNDPNFKKYFCLVDAMALDLDDIIEIAEDGDDYDMNKNEDWVKAIKYDVVNHILGDLVDEVEDNYRKGVTAKEKKYIKDLNDNIYDYIHDNNKRLNQIIDESNLFDGNCAKYDSTDVRKFNEMLVDMLYQAIHKVLNSKK